MIFQIWCYLCTNNVPHWLPVIFIILSNDVHLNPGPHFQNNVPHWLPVIFIILSNDVHLNPGPHFQNNVPHWLPVIFIILSNDVHLNPGPHFQNNVFNFISLDTNSLAKGNFQRVRLIEAHNSTFNYDLISICETSLNESVGLPGTLLDDYTFVPANTSNGVVGLFYKNSPPVIVRNDLSFDELIVVELKFGRKKIFFTVLAEVLLLNIPLPNFVPFCQISKNYIQKSIVCQWMCYKMYSCVSVCVTKRIRVSVYVLQNVFVCQCRCVHACARVYMYVLCMCVYV